MNLLKSQLIRATSWSLLQRVGTMLISFVTNMILARLLTPDDFGCVGLILTFVSIADLFVDAGLGQSLIQKQNVDLAYISIVWGSISGEQLRFLLKKNPFAAVKWRDHH